MPWGFELLEDRLEGIQGYEDAYQVRTHVIQTETAELPFTYWRVMPDGVIRIGYPSLGPLSMVVREEGLALVGTAQSVGDALPLGSDALRPRSVTAHRVRCNARPGS